MLFLNAYISSVVLINYAFSTAPHLAIIWAARGGLAVLSRVRPGVAGLFPAYDG